MLLLMYKCLDVPICLLSFLHTDACCLSAMTMSVTTFIIQHTKKSHILFDWHLFSVDNNSVSDLVKILLNIIYFYVDPSTTAVTTVQ